MKQTEYIIKVHSIARFIIAFYVILMSSVIFILGNLPIPDNDLISTIEFLAVVSISFYLSQLFAMGKVKIELTQEGIKHIWQRRFILSWEKSFIIPWKLVDDDGFQRERVFDSFIINLPNKKRYKVNRLNILPIKDDFIQLVKDFPKLSSNYKNELDSHIEGKSIKEGKSNYVRSTSVWVSYLFFTGFLHFTISKAGIATKRRTNFSGRFSIIPL